MAVLDLAAYKPVPATLGDANQIANGFTAIQACINALDNNNFAAGKIFDPLKLMQDGATAGQALIWSAAANGGTGGWVPGSVGLKTTVSSWAGGPPGSPADTDIWVATAVGPNNVRWTFQWSLANTRWEFAGGGKIHKNDYTHTFVYSGGGAAQDPASALTGVAAQTLARAGVYLARGIMTVIDTTGGVHDSQLQHHVSGAAQGNTAIQSAGTGDDAGSFAVETTCSLTAGQTIGLLVASGVNSMSFEHASLTIEPLWIT